jgi:undecaprenyl-diphosphatase
MHDIFLGGLQGLTEFLPISSSGHLGLAQHLLGLDADAVARTVTFHVGTVLAVCVFFFREILEALRQPRFLGHVLTATLLTAAIGLLLRTFLGGLFASPFWIGVFLLLNGLFLLLTRAGDPERRRRISLSDAVVMGLAQGIAVLPGISRSGTTIATLLLRGCDREQAFRFSFIASLPVIGAAFILEVATSKTTRLFTDPSVYLGIAMAFFIGLLALYVLKGLLLLKRFYLFGFYCLALGALSILVFT